MQSPRVRDVLGVIGRSEVAGIIVGLLAMRWAFAPGLLTPDSTWMLDQAETGDINDWLAPNIIWSLRVLHIDGSMWFTLNTLAFLVVASRVLRRACSPVVAGGGAALIALSPPVLGWLSALGRDTTCGIALLGMVLAATGERPHGRWQVTARVAGLGMLGSVAVAARQNAALPVAALFAFAVAWALPQLTPARRLAIAAVVGCLAAAGIFVAQSLFAHHVVQAHRLYPEQATYVTDTAAISLRTGDDRLAAVSWRAGVDYARLAEVWADADPTLIFNTPAPPMTTVSTSAAAAAERDAWLDAIRAHPLSYLRHRARVMEIMLFESTELTDAYVPGMVGTVAGHDLERPAVTARVVDLQDGFWRLSGLRVWHLLLAGAVATWCLRRHRLAGLLLALQVASWSTLLSLAPTAPGGYYRFAWLPVCSSVLTLVIAASLRWPRFGQFGKYNTQAPMGTWR